MGLTWQAGDTPASHNTLETVTLGDGSGVDHLVLLENSVD